MLNAACSAIAASVILAFGSTSAALGEEFSLVVLDGSPPSVSKLATGLRNVIAEDGEHQVVIMEEGGQAVPTGGIVLVTSDQLEGPTGIKPDQLDILALLAGEYHVMVVSPESRYSVLSDVTSQLKKDPSTVKWVVAKSASASLRQGIADIAEARGVDPLALTMDVVSSPEATVDASSFSSTSVAMAPLSSVIENVENHTLRALGITGAVRQKDLEIPTFNEQGLRADSKSWIAAAVSPQMDAEMRQRLADIIGDAVATDLWREQLEKDGMHDLYTPSERLGSFVESEGAATRKDSRAGMLIE
ncbi:MAG: hypothetical protein EOS34_28070 [Mesorhizobium sp.]|nr:MAG: hypothetical protein EOS34_28070 [Mesorhizobium sp.]